MGFLIIADTHNTCSWGL